jgi:glycerol-3-phosphate acyltransferase PlsX
MLLDVGASLDSSVAVLVQHAALGARHASALLGLATPRIGLLSVGAEEGKGDRMRRIADDHLRRTVAGYVGNVEGHDVPLGGPADVVVTDGFTGNVLLKTAEGAVWAFGQLLKRQIQSSRVATAAARLMKSQLEQVKRRVDYEEVGGAPLLGVHGVAMIAHGRSTHRAILNALSGAEAFAGQHLEEDLAAAARRGEDLLAQRAAS